MSAITRDARLLTPKEVALELGVHASSIRRAISRGELEALTLGEHGHYRIRRQALDAYLRPALRRERNEQQ